MLENLQPILSKKLGAAMTAIVCLTMLENPDKWLVGAIVAIVCVHMACQTVIDVRKGHGKKQEETPAPDTPQE